MEAPKTGQNFYPGQLWETAAHTPQLPTPWQCSLPPPLTWTQASRAVFAQQILSMINAPDKHYLLSSH